MHEHEIECPFCGESFTVLIDPSQDRQEYVEDCFVCCRPIRFDVRCADDEIVDVAVSRE
jgi:hypothetical protein